MHYSVAHHFVTQGHGASHIANMQLQYQLSCSIAYCQILRIKIMFLMCVLSLCTCKDSA